jgi:hypothetical protein
MKYISRILFISALALGLLACSDSIRVYDPVDESCAGDMTVNITAVVSGTTPATKSKVSGTENKVQTMQMVCFDANGLYLGIRNATVTSKDATPDTGKIKGTVPQGTSRIHFIANRNLSIPLLSNVVGTPESEVMGSEELSTIWNDEDHKEVCYWGYHKEANATAMEGWLNPTATQGNSKVYLIRDRARVVLTYDPTGSIVPVTKIEWLIHNGRERGYLAPAVESWTNTGYYANSTVEGHTDELVSVAKMNEYTSGGRYSLYTSATENDEDNFDTTYDSTKGGNLMVPQFLFDDDNEEIDGLKAILRVTYTVDGSPKTVYHVLKLNRIVDNVNETRELYDIVRNNTYYIKAKLLSPDVAYYETLEDAINGTEFMNADMEVDRSITEINNKDYTLQILLPTETTSIVLNTETEWTMDFAFREVADITQTGSTNPADFDIKWEKSQTFCSDPTLTYNSTTKLFTIHTTVLEDQLTQNLQSEWIVVKHKASGLTRFIHVFAIDQFRYKIYPKLTRVGTGNYGDCLLTFQLPPMEHTKFLPDGSPDPKELVYPQELYPIEVKFTTNTLNAYGTSQGVTNYGLFGVAVESTSGLVTVENFEDEYDDPVSSTDYAADRTHWYYQQGGNFWDFWYTYSLKTCPEDGLVNIYLKDVRQNIAYANVADVGLFLYVEYFGKNYSIPLSTD